MFDESYARKAREPLFNMYFDVRYQNFDIDNGSWFRALSGGILTTRKYWHVDKRRDTNSNTGIELEQKVDETWPKPEHMSKGIRWDNDGNTGIGNSL